MINELFKDKLKKHIEQFLEKEGLSDKLEVDISLFPGVLDSVEVLSLIGCIENFIETELDINISLFLYENIDYPEPLRDINIIIQYVFESLLKFNEILDKKLIIVDLDNTLWGGIVGDDEYLVIDDIYKERQMKLKKMVECGYLLAICSKNESINAMKVINENEQMILKEKDFVSYRINWEDKYKNILEIINELNILPESVVFIDDMPQERDFTKAMIPSLQVLDILELDQYDVDSISKKRIITKEDKIRLNFFKVESDRRKSSQKFESEEKWLESLGIRVFVDIYNRENAARVIQLLNKTNQMNLTTRRLNKNEFDEWLQLGDNTMFVFSSSDKYGDCGIIGLLGLERTENVVYIRDFILSCRVFKRGLEKTMLYYAYLYALSKEVSEIKARYYRTEKNLLCFDFFKNKSGFDCKIDNLFSLKVNILLPYEKPIWVNFEEH